MIQLHTRFVARLSTVLRERAEAFSDIMQHPLLQSLVGSGTEAEFNALIDGLRAQVTALDDDAKAARRVLRQAEWHARSLGFEVKDDGP